MCILSFKNNAVFQFCDGCSFKKIFSGGKPQDLFALAQSGPSREFYVLGTLK